MQQVRDHERQLRKERIKNSRGRLDQARAWLRVAMLTNSTAWLEAAAKRIAVSSVHQMYLIGR